MSTKMLEVQNLQQAITLITGADAPFFIYKLRTKYL